MLHSFEKNHLSRIKSILLLFSLLRLTQEQNMDVEEPFQGRRRGAHGSASSHSTLPHNHPVNILYRFGVIGGSLYALHELKVFHNIVRNPDVDHQWFKIGLAATIG